MQPLFVVFTYPRLSYVDLSPALFYCHFLAQQGRCMPAGLYGKYPLQGPGGRGRLFTLINHYNMAKQTITRSVSPWMTIMSEEKVTQQETETAQKLA